MSAPTPNLRVCVVHWCIGVGPTCVDSREWGAKPGKCRFRWYVLAKDGEFQPRTSPPLTGDLIEDGLTYP